MKSPITFLQHPQTQDRKPPHPDLTRPSPPSRNSWYPGTKGHRVIGDWASSESLEQKLAMYTSRKPTQDWTSIDVCHTGYTQACSDGTMAPGPLNITWLLAFWHTVTWQGGSPGCSSDSGRAWDRRNLDNNSYLTSNIPIYPVIPRRGCSPLWESVSSSDNRC